jgi:hypothetical protein
MAPAAWILRRSVGRLRTTGASRTTDASDIPTGAAWSAAGVFPGARAERFHRDRPFQVIYVYPVKNPATRTIEKPRRSGAFP